MQNILVTGGNGFIGSHLVKRLIDLGNFKVVVPYIEIIPKSYFLEQGLDKKTIFIACDVRDFKKTKKIIEKYKIDFIFHLAAKPIVEEALASPIETFESNIMGTVNVLEAARQSDTVRGVIVTSSDKAYGKITRASETDPLSGDHPYEASKAAADMIATTYFRTYGLPVVITRFGNVYGEGDLYFNRIVPGIMKALICDEELEIRSNGKYVRDYVYVGDIIDALMVLYENLGKVKGEAFNISSQENLSVLEVIDKVGKILNTKIRYRILNKAVNEIPKQSVNFGKIKRRVSWRPKKKLDSTIVGIYNWYGNYFLP